MTMQIELNSRKYPGRVALVDDEDYELVSRYNWWPARRPNGVFYAAAHTRKEDGTPTTVLMHRLLLPESKEVDHVNHDGLNNTRTNIRPATHAENMRNRRPYGKSKYKGVYWDTGRGIWKAQVTHNKRVMFLGRYDTEVDAAFAYDKFALQNYGEFALTNFTYVTVRFDLTTRKATLVLAA